MNDLSNDDAPLPPDLRFLKTLVTVLTSVMILGVITIVALLVIRLNDNSGAVLVHPESFDLPPGIAATGYSIWNGHAVIVGDDGLIRVYRISDGELRDTLQIPTN